MFGSRLRHAWVFVAVSVVLGGCASNNDDPRSLAGNRQRPGTSAAEDVPDAGNLPEGGLDYAAGLALLPFDVRLAKVADVAGVSTADPSLDLLKARRYELGDHDYSNGVKPDLTWTPSRIGTWVKALRPVCASRAMRQRYPALPEKLDALVLAAYGRDVTDEDRAAIKETVVAAALDSESQYRLICLAILSSLEFVAR